MAFAARASLIVTDNLRDFDTKDADRVETRVVATAAGERHLKAYRHRRGAADVVVAHPLDVIAWYDRRLDVEPDALWKQIAS